LVACIATDPDGAVQGRSFRGGDDEDPALTRALACEETRWASGTWSPDRTVRDLRLHDVVVVLGGDSYLARMGDVAPGSRVIFDGVVHETRARAGGIEARRTDVVLSEVVTTYIRDADALVEIEVVTADGAAHSIVGTPEHPIFVPSREAFVPLGELRPGAILRTTAGGEAVVRRVRALADSAPVYNIEVAHTHTYFAGGHALARGEVLVHNTCDPPGGGAVRELDPNTIRFTQNTAGRTFRNGMTLRETIAGLRNGTISPSAFPPIRVFQRGGHTFSLDNRRLFIFQQVGLPIRAVGASTSDIGRRAISTINNGVSIHIRGGL